MSPLLDRGRAFAQTTEGTIPGWAAWRFQRMDEIRFIAEALSWEVVGRFEHPQTTSVRMESAIAKMLVSELLHQLIEWTEDIYGLAGQTQLHLIEKRKRDARILTIYEGTNEIQRFFILKDLATEMVLTEGSAENMALGASGSGPAPPASLGMMGREALELEALRREVRQRVGAASQFFGQELWQNPNLQANCFLLAEAAAWFKAADSTLGRLAWLERQIQADETAEPTPKLDLARWAVLRCVTEVRHRLNRFDEELAHLRRGYYAPDVRAATLLFDRVVQAVPVRAIASRIAIPLSILVVVEPSAAAVPHPRVTEGRLLEPHLSWNDADRSALEVALRLRDQAEAAVTITVAAVGPERWAPVLREALSLGVDRVRLISSADPVAPDSAADALATAFREKVDFDLILGGNGDASNQEGLVARLTAEALGIPYAGHASRLVVHKTETEAELLLFEADAQQQRVRSLPAALSLEPGLPLRPFTVAGYLAGLEKPVEVERWNKRVPVHPLLLQERSSENASAEPDELPHLLTPVDAARLTQARIGLGDGSANAAESFEGAIEDVSVPTFAAGGVVAVLLADGDGRLLPTAQNTVRAAHVIAACDNAPLTVLLLVPRSEPSQRRALAHILKGFHGPVILLAAGSENDVPEIKSRLLEESWSGVATKLRAVVGEPWAEGAFAALSRHGQPHGVAALRIRRVALEEQTVVLEAFQAGGKLVTQQTITDEPDLTYWITITADGDVKGGLAADTEAVSQIQRWSPGMNRLYGQRDIQRLLDEVKQEIGIARLADAEFIVDVGYGVGNRDGYEAVIEPLERTLRELGVRGLMIGGSRKVTEELRLLPADRQIGQSGVSVNPQVLLAIGISGAPQHVSYIGRRATILAFNRDPEAPIMTLNERQPGPRVFSILGDLFDTVPAFTAALRQAVAASPLEEQVAGSPRHGVESR
ncbi:MAG TPA: FAD-binding protein, partial [Gemmataceae bacterium]|nr:FAD-binding protein [Gemmataceae bacterium]